LLNYVRGFRLRFDRRSATIVAGDRTGCSKEFTMRYRSVAMSVAALSLAQISVADAQSVYVAPGNGPPVSVYAAPPAVYGPPAPVYAAPAPGYGGGTVYNGGTVYRAPAPVYGGGTVYGASTYVVRERVGAPLSAYAAEIAPRPPAPVPYYGRGRW
jgi:hypothetical protein